MAIDETVALQAMLSRPSRRAAERRDIADGIAEAAAKWAAEERKQITNLQAALLAFGFEVGPSK